MRISGLSVLLCVLLAACTNDVVGRPARERPRLPVRDIGPGEAQPDAPRCIPSDSATATYGTTGHDEFRDVAVTADGSIVITGFENGHTSSAGIPLGSRGIVLEYDTHFTPLASLDTNGTDAFESIALDPADGRVWLAARTDAAVPAFAGYGAIDVLLGDLGSSGFRPMARGFYATPEYPKQLAAGGGLVAIAGHEERAMNDGSARDNPFLAAFGARDGMPRRWMTTRRHSDAERYTAVDVSAEGVVSGGAIRAGELPGMFVIAWDQDAGVRWQHRLSTLGSDELAAIRILPGGDVLWAGSTGALLGDDWHGGTDIVVGRLSATGASMWIAQLGTERDEHVADLAVDGAGRIYVAGDLTAADSSERDAFLLVLDEAGDIVIEEQWISSGDDVPTALAVDACGTVVLVGTTLAGPTRGGRDGFVIVTQAGE